MKKVMFNSKLEIYLAIQDGQIVKITQEDCYRFVNSNGVKCYGSESTPSGIEFTIYMK